jgi:hypothetical protein
MTPTALPSEPPNKYEVGKKMAIVGIIPYMTNPYKNRRMISAQIDMSDKGRLTMVHVLLVGFGK